MKNIAQIEERMSITLFKLQSNKFGIDNIEATLVCSMCAEVFQKSFPYLEGQTIEFKCSVFNLNWILI